MMPEKAIAAKILHDLASPLTALSFIADDNPDVKIIADEMIWRLRCLRYIFVSESVSRAEIQPFIQHIQTNLEGDMYSKALLIVGYMFKNRAVKVEKVGKALMISTGLIAHLDDEQNVLISYLKKELHDLNLVTQMI